MKIYVAELKEGVPVRVHRVYDPKKLELELVDMKFLEPLDVAAEVVREKDTVTLQGRVSSRVRRICGRTLREIDEDLRVDFTRYYVAEAAGVIDALDDIREAVLLDQPMVYYAPDTESLNREDPRNERASEKGRKKRDNPFSRLRDLKDRLKEDPRDGKS